MHQNLFIHSPVIFSHDLGETLSSLPLHSHNFGSCSVLFQIQIQNGEVTATEVISVMCIS